MSGGWPVTGRRGARGITRSAQALARKNGDTPRVACNGLDGLGPQAPLHAMSVRIIAKGNSVSDGAQRSEPADAETG